jgi:hypothetical protein
MSDDLRRQFQDAATSPSGPVDVDAIAVRAAQLRHRAKAVRLSGSAFVLLLAAGAIAVGVLGGRSTHETEILSTATTPEPTAPTTQAPVTAATIQPTTSTTQGPSTTTPPRLTTTKPPSFDVPVGNYGDAGAGLPHYVLTVSRGADGVATGWLFFVYQDGNTAVAFHYHAIERADDIVTITTDSSSEPFPYVSRSPSATVPPIRVGQTFTATYQAADRTITLQGCSDYLYFANPATSPVPSSCIFTFQGSTI